MSFDFYFAGTQCKEADDVIDNLGANVLKSYINDRKSIQDWVTRRHNGWKGKLMIDNGAFTVHRQGGAIDIDEYIKWLNTNIDDFDYAIALDNIAGTWGVPRKAEELFNSPIITWQNYLYMVERVKSPHKLLPVFHMGENFKHLVNMLESPYLLSDYICLAGNKELTNQQREVWYEQCFNVIKKSSRPHIKTHCLGSATVSNAEKYPFTSMDATSWIMSGANGCVLTDYGAIAVGKKSRLSKDECDKLSLILDEYGLTLEQVRSDYKCRMIANVNYLYKASMKCRDAQFMASKRRLF